jgi:glycerophosphoryl diester phosphodiesterase
MDRSDPCDDRWIMTRSGELTLCLGAKPWIVGHRGAPASALENTLPSMVAALGQGARMIEVDVQLTADRVPVVFHDWDLRRLAGRGEIVERTSLDQLEGIELREPSGRWSGRVPKLEDVLAAVETSVALNLEIKSRLHAVDDLLTALEPVFEQQRPVLVSSFDWGLLAELRRRRKDLPIAPIARFRADELLEIGERLEAFSIHAHRDLAPELLGQAAPRRRPVLVYTVNDHEEARRLVFSGATGVFTDSPGPIASALEADV